MAPSHDRIGARIIQDLETSPGVEWLWAAVDYYGPEEHELTTRVVDALKPVCAVEDAHGDSINTSQSDVMKNAKVVIRQLGQELHNLGVRRHGLQGEGFLTLETCYRVLGKYLCTQHATLASLVPFVSVAWDGIGCWLH